MIDEILDRPRRSDDRLSQTLHLYGDHGPAIFATLDYVASDHRQLSSRRWNSEGGRPHRQALMSTPPTPGLELVELECRLLGRTRQTLLNPGETGHQCVISEAFPRLSRIVDRHDQPAALGRPREMQELALRQRLAPIGMHNVQGVLLLLACAARETEDDSERGHRGQPPGQPARRGLVTHPPCRVAV
jgi:hypothetical protein